MKVHPPFWSITLVLLCSGARPEARADEVQSLSIHVQAFEVGGSPIVDLGMSCRSLFGPILGRGYTSVNGALTFNVTPQSGTDRIIVVPGAVARPAHPTSDVRTVVEHFKNLITTRSLPSSVEVPLVAGQVEYETVIQARSAVVVNVCRPGLSDRLRRVPQVLCPTSTIATDVTNLEGGCFRILGVPQNRPCDLVFLTETAFASIVSLSATQLADDLDLGALEHEFPAASGHARLSFQGQWKYGIGLTLLPTEGNWLLILSPSPSDGTIRQHYNGPVELSLPIGTYLVLPGTPGHRPEHAKAFAARRQGLVLRDLGIPLLEVSGESEAVLSFDPVEALGAAQSLTVIDE